MVQRIRDFPSFPQLLLSRTSNKQGLKAAGCHQSSSSLLEVTESPPWHCPTKPAPKCCHKAMLAAAQWAAGMAGHQKDSKFKLVQRDPTGSGILLPHYMTRLSQNVTMST